MSTKLLAISLIFFSDYYTHYILIIINTYDLLIIINR